MLAAARSAVDGADELWSQAAASALVSCAWLTDWFPRCPVAPSTTASSSAKRSADSAATTGVDPHQSGAPARRRRGTGTVVAPCGAGFGGVAVVVPGAAGSGGAAAVAGGPAWAESST